MNDYLEQWFMTYETELQQLEYRIWAHPEVAMEEQYACQQTIDFLRQQGFQPTSFSLTENGIDNTVIATYGEGKPVIGILGEYDALPNLGQEAVSYHAPLDGAGHGCGHCQIITCALGAASALKQVMEQESLSGTLVFMATPAEEALQGKVIMAAKGYFDELDLCFFWHPCDCALSFDYLFSASSSDVTFEFFGKSAHAAMQPWLGRSALDAAELMNIGAQYLREHITEDCKLHYSYLSAGSAPNIVPDYAAVRYLIRSNDENHDKLMAQVIRIAEGAAHMTETTMKYQISSHCWGSFPNKVLNDFCYNVAKTLPDMVYTDKEYDFARALYENAMEMKANDEKELLLPRKILPPKEIYIAGSSDIGDVSHLVPTIQIRGLGRVKGTPGHHWSMVAASGSSIGAKASVYAAKTMAYCVYEALKSPDLVQECWEEFYRVKSEKHIPAYQKFLKE